MKKFVYQAVPDFISHTNNMGQAGVLLEWKIYKISLALLEVM